MQRIAPYFAGTRRGFALVIVGAIVGAATEPAIPALLKPLLDSGFKAGTLQLWLVPVAIIGIFVIRGLAGFIAQYGLSWSAKARCAGIPDNRTPCRRIRKCSQGPPNWEASLFA